jgi:hypothetical protein
MPRDKVLKVANWLMGQQLKSPQKENFCEEVEISSRQRLGKGEVDGWQLWSEASEVRDYDLFQPVEKNTH